MQAISEASGELLELNALAQCNTEKEIEATVEGITSRLGFAYFMYEGHFTLDRTKNIERVLSNFPADRLRQAQSKGLPGLEGVINHASRRLTPLVWREQAQESGVWAGVSFPVHHKDGDVGVLSLVPEADADNEGRMQDEWLYGATIANFVHEAMLQLVRKSELLLKAPLTPRELECLKWVADGKSTWEIAKILGISEHGVQHHVRNTMDKFDVTSRHKAVARAIACGLL
jgi:LuxR family quorum-sensing transcriptional regulator LasR